jgi:hypothetical protein
MVEYYNHINMNQKGLGKILIIGIVLAVAIIVGGYFIYNKNEGILRNNSNVLVGQYSKDQNENNQSELNSTGLKDAVEVLLSNDMKEKFLEIANQKLGYEYYDATEARLFKGSFIEPFSEEYLLTLGVEGVGAYSIIYFGIFDKDNNLLMADSIGGGTHSFASFNLYKCNNKGVNLLLLYFKGCSNGSPFCNIVLDLDNFTNNGFSHYQNIFSNKGIVKIEKNRIDIYKWKIYDYSSLEDYEKSVVKESDCKEPECIDYWEYSPYTKSFLLFDRSLNYNENECIFK